MASGSYRFDRFVLDAQNRQLLRDGTPVELNARYLDALALMVREPGKLVSKDRFVEEVWRGVPVTDEALTQCVKTLRRQLGDEAGRPRFIETVPKHGYRFVASVEPAEDSAPSQRTVPRDAAGAGPWREVLLLGAAGTIGGASAGIIGGLFYGFAGSGEPLAPGVGAVSVLLVLLCLTTIVALLGGAGVAFGIAAAQLAAQRRWLWSIFGGAAGGLVIGAMVKLIGLDAFSLLFGRTPGDITGAAEGLMTGASVGLGAWLGQRAGLPSLRRGMTLAALSGAAGGALISLLGGRMMAGSLDLLARQFPDSRLRLDAIANALGESGFGPVSQLVTGALEGALFAAGVVGAMIIARRSLGGSG